MLKNYIAVALRNIGKHKFYAALNLSGLAFGLTTSLLIALYVYDELSFDRFHDGYENIYQAGMHINFGEQGFKGASSCPVLGLTIQNTIPGIDKVTRTNSFMVKDLVVRYDDKAFTETKAILVDSNFFDFFSFRLIEGNPKTVLREPRSIVITPETATRYFGDQQAIGKLVLVGPKSESYTVAGIVAPAPTNSQINYELLISASSEPSMHDNDWGNNNGTLTYFKKNAKTSFTSIQKKLRSIVEVYIGREIEQWFGITLKEFEKQGGVFTYFAYPLTDNHLYQTDVTDKPGALGDIKYVVLVGAVGIFILVIACINFMNLATARSASRAREVGLRKTLGSLRSSLITQFLAESFVYVFSAMIVAFVAVYFLLPAFNLLSGKQLSIASLLSPEMIGIITAVFVVVALLAGSYPAFYLTSFKPVEVLKGNVTTGTKSKTIRSGLVIMQFTISIALIICTLVVFNQLAFLQSRNIGMDNQQVIVLQNTDLVGKHHEAFLNSVQQTNGIVAASYTSNVFPEINQATLYRAEGETHDHLFYSYRADYRHLDVLKMKLEAGRFFSKDFPSDSMACVINEAVARELGWKDPLSEKLVIYDPQHSHFIKVIGVVRDFNFQSFKAKIKPVVIRLRKAENSLLVRYEGSPEVALNSLEQQWKKYAANEPFNYVFMDQNFDSLFREERRLGQLFGAMTSIAVFIACLGLLGLASFTAEQRTREIGIRKVMGASVGNINLMLSKEFMMLVGVAFLIASAGAWYAMDIWLTTFAFRVSLNPLLFAVSGVVAATIAWLTVSYHFFKASTANPVDALRNP